MGYRQGHTALRTQPVRCPTDWEQSKDTADDNEDSSDIDCRNEFNNNNNIPTYPEKHKSWAGKWSTF